jgi:hypothetical protein
MSLEAAITENTAAIRELIATLANGVAAAPVSTSAAAPAAGEPARGRGRPKKEPAPAPAATSAEPETAVDDDPFADEAPAAEPEKPKAYAVEDVRKALIELSKTNRDKATAIMKSCTNKDGKPCASIGEIPTAEYARVVKEAEAAL